MLRVAIALVMFAAAMTDPAAQVVGQVRWHHVVAGDTLVSLGARAGVDSRTLAIDNALDPRARLQAGGTIVIDNRHVVPGGYRDGIVINVPQRMLFLVQHGEAVKAFPVAVGRPDWRTPVGSFAVTVKEVDPEWNVPQSIQREMARAGRPVLTTVRPGPHNPLGKHWLGLDDGAVGIHGTNEPSSIYRFTTHGCIRMHPDDVADLFDSVAIGALVQVIYEPVLLGTDDAGTFLEVHPDIYGRTVSASALAADRLWRANLAHLVDTPAVKRVIAERAGRAVRVTNAAR